MSVSIERYTIFFDFLSIHINDIKQKEKSTQQIHPPAFKYQHAHIHTQSHSQLYSYVYKTRC